MRKHDLRQPREKEIIAHEMMHLPFRSMAQFVVEDQDCRVRHERRSGGTVDSSRDGWSRNVEDILKDDEFVDVNKKIASRAVQKCAPCWRGVRTLKRRSTIVWCVSGLGGETFEKLHANCTTRTLGRRFRLQRECIYPKRATDE